MTEPAPHIYVIFLLTERDILISRASTELVKQLPIEVLKWWEKKNQCSEIWNQSITTWTNHYSMESSLDPFLALSDSQNLFVSETAGF